MDRHDKKVSIDKETGSRNQQKKHVPLLFSTFKVFDFAERKE